MILPFVISVLAAMGQPVAGPVAQTPTQRVLVTRDLVARQVLVTRLGEVVKYQGVNGRSQSMPLTEVLAILPAASRPGSHTHVVDPDAEPDGASRAVLALATGEKVPGVAVWPEMSSESFGWRSELLGQFAVKLDEVLGWHAEGTLMPSSTGGGDVLRLANGDTLSGFLATVSTGKISIEVDKKTRTVDPAVVVAASLSTPAKPGSGPMVFLDDGTALLIDGLAAGTGDAQSGAVLAATRRGQALSIRADSVTAYAADAAALTSLAALPQPTMSPTGGRSWTPGIEVADATAPLGISDIVLPGPMEATWTLPGKAGRIAATLELDPASRVWGDCLVTVTLTPAKGGGGAGGVKDLLKARLNEDSPTASFTAETAGGGTIRVRVEPGERGPVQDRVIIRRPMILLGQPSKLEPKPDAKPKPEEKKPSAEPSTAG